MRDKLYSDGKKNRERKPIAQKQQEQKEKDNNKQFCAQCIYSKGSYWSAKLCELGHKTVTATHGYWDYTLKQRIMSDTKPIEPNCTDYKYHIKKIVKPTLAKRGPGNRYRAIQSSPGYNEETIEFLALSEEKAIALAREYFELGHYYNDPFPDWDNRYDPKNPDKPMWKYYLKVKQLKD